MKNKKRPICVDFDGTVVTHEFPRIGRDIGAVPWLKKLNELGAGIILWTMRNDDPDNNCFFLSDAVNWYKRNDIELFGINKNPEQSWTTSPKAYSEIYVDDASLNAPLKVSELVGERPYIDWDIAGPMLIKWIRE